MQATPQAVTSASGAHLPAQGWVPTGHAGWQAPAVHTAEPPPGTAHTVHAAPHAVASVSEAHLAPAHAWNVGLHVALQTPIVHALTALATFAHGAPQPPQWFVLVIGSTHTASHLRGSVGAHPLVHWNVGPFGAQSGATAPHTALHPPHDVAFDRSVSQPSAAFALQSANPPSHLAITHLRPWHAIVLWSVGQGVQEGSPQPWSGSFDETHEPAHRCCPVGQGSPASGAGVGAAESASGAGFAGVPLSTSPGTPGSSPGGGKVPASLVTSSVPGSLSRIVLQPTTVSTTTLVAIER